MTHDSRRWTGRYAAGASPFKDPPKPYRRPWVRWMLVFVILLALALMIGQLWVTPVPGEVMPIGWGLAVPGLGAGIGLSPFARRLLPIADAAHDEFERLAIMRAGTLAYVALLALMVVAMAYCGWAEIAGWPRPHRITDWLAWAFGLAVIGTNLPATIAEFAVPFPAEDDPG